MSQTIGPADVAVITGGASGIGLALGQALAAKGVAVLLADIEGPKAEAAAQAIRDQGGAALGCFVDVADPASNQALADFAFERFGRVTLVFLNAGIGAGGSIHKASRANIAWTFEVNVMGTIDGARVCTAPARAGHPITSGHNGLRTWFGLAGPWWASDALYRVKTRLGGPR